MNISYLLSYIILAIVLCLFEFLIFGLWYRLFIKGGTVLDGNSSRKSSVGYLAFLKRMMKYYKCRLRNPKVSELEGKPETAYSMILIYAVFIPILFPSFILITDNLAVRCFFFFGGIFVLADKLFRDERTKIEVQVNRWVQFLYSPECLALFARGKEHGRSGNGIKIHSEQFVGRKESIDIASMHSGEEVSSTDEEVPMTKEELRKSRIRMIPPSIAVLACGAAYINGLIVDARAGIFGTRESLLMFFADEQANRIFCITFVILFITIVLTLVTDRDFRDEEKKRAAVYVDSKKRIFKNLTGLSSGIYVDSSLEEWEQAVVRMCDVLNVRLVAVMSESVMSDGLSGRLAMTASDPEGIPVIVLSTKEIGRLRTQYSAQTVHDMVRFLIGHELTHVRHKDYSKRRNAAKDLVITVSFLTILTGTVYLVTFLPKSLELLGVAFLIMILLVAILFRVNVLSDSYRGYVSEYRADRISAAISGVSMETIELLLGNKKDDQGKYKSVFTKKSTHPDGWHRMCELKRGKKWGALEYVRYAIRLEW